MKLPAFAFTLLLLGGAAQAQVDPDVTEDGLVRVPSSRKVGVYRAPDVPFTQYQRVIIGSIPVSFSKSWERRFGDVKDEDRENMRGDLSIAFRKELEKELVERGGYELASEPAPDVLRVDATITQLEINAPMAGTVPTEKTYVRSAGSMRLVVELRDAASGVLVARIIDFERAREYPVFDRTHDFSRMPPANHVMTAEELRLGLENAARYTREALNVAKTERHE